MLDPGNWMNGAKATQFQTAYAVLINHFSSQSPHPEVCVALPPPAYPKNAPHIGGTILQGSIVPFGKQVAAQNGALIIDGNTAMMGMRSLFGDGLHPTDMGYTVLAKVFHDELLQPVPIDAGTADRGSIQPVRAGAGKQRLVLVAARLRNHRVARDFASRTRA